jgi:hypothetical protein
MTLPSFVDHQLQRVAHLSPVAHANLAFHSDATPVAQRLAVSDDAVPRDEYAYRRAGVEQLEEADCLSGTVLVVVEVPDAPG